MLTILVKYSDIYLFRVLLGSKLPLNLSSSGLARSLQLSAYCQYCQTYCHALQISITIFHTKVMLSAYCQCSCSSDIIENLTNVDHTSNHSLQSYFGIAKILSNIFIPICQSDVIKSRRQKMFIPICQSDVIISRRQKIFML